MPNYDYKCNSCKNEFEEFQSMSDEPRAKCPKCGKKAKRIFSPGTGIIFKGSGFYVNDYKKKESSTSSNSSKVTSTPPASSTTPTTTNTTK